jgi:hypothetical protein
MIDKLKTYGIYYSNLSELVNRNPNIYYDVTTIPESIYSQLQFNLIKFVNNVFVNTKNLDVIDFKADDRLYVLYALNNEPFKNYIDTLLVLSKNQVKVYVYCNDVLKDYFENKNLIVIGNVKEFIRNLVGNTIYNQNIVNNNTEVNIVQNISSSTIANNQSQTVMPKKRGRPRKYF